MLPSVSASPLLCLMEARVMQSCSRSSLGRWSMDVLVGIMERGFFFFSGSGDTNGSTQRQTCRNTSNWTQVKFSLSHPCFLIQGGRNKLLLLFCSKEVHLLSKTLRSKYLSYLVCLCSSWKWRLFVASHKQQKLSFKTKKRMNDVTFEFVLNGRLSSVTCCCRTGR